MDSYSYRRIVHHAAIMVTVGRGTMLMEGKGNRQNKHISLGESAAITIVAVVRTAAGPSGVITLFLHFFPLQRPEGPTRA